MKKNAVNTRLVLRLAICFMLIISFTFAVNVSFNNRVRSETVKKEFHNGGTLTVKVLTTEPYSDSIYIFRLSSDDSTVGTFKTMRFAVGFDDTPEPLLDSGGNQVLSSLGEPVYVSSTTMRLKCGVYKIESPADSRWRHKDVTTCINYDYKNSITTTSPDDVNIGDDYLSLENYEVLLTPHSRFNGFGSNRISFNIAKENTQKDVTCVYNFIRSNERWLSAAYLTEGLSE